MRKRWPAWAVPALALGLFAAALYGLNENQLRSGAMAERDANNQSSFHSMAYDVDEMQDALAKALITTEPHMILQQLKDAARAAAVAQADGSHLLSSLQTRDNLQSFLGRVVADSDALATRHIDGSLLTPPEVQNLRTLYQGATVIERDLRDEQARMLASPTAPQATWLAIGTTSRRSSSLLQQHLTNIDRGVPPQATSEARTLSQGAPLSRVAAGSVIGTAKAINSARAFTALRPPVAAFAEPLGPGYDVHGYLVTLRSRNNPRQTTFVAVSSHGGRVLWMTRPRTTGVARVNVYQTQRIASHFLRAHGLSRVALLESDNYAGMSVFRFGPTVGKMIDSRRPLFVQVDRTDGKITGFDASAYDQPSDPPIAANVAITPLQARNHLRPTLRVEETHLEYASVPALGIAKPVYVILGRTADSTFRVYVDAQTGRQLEIDKLTKDDA